MLGVVRSKGSTRINFIGTLEKMEAILQKAISKPFSSLKKFSFRLRFNSFLGQYTSTHSDNVLGLLRTATGHYLIRSLQWRHNGHGGVSNYQTHDCLLNRLFRRRSTKTSKLRVTGHCAGNSPVTGEFPAQMASNAENVSIWWRHHGWPYLLTHIYASLALDELTNIKIHQGMV